MPGKEMVFAAINFIQNNLIETSSSSSDDDHFINKEKEIHKRVQNFIREIVVGYSHDEFKNNFRLTRECAYYLVGEYCRSNYYSVRQYKGGKPQNSAETEILSFLWFSSNKASYREVSNLFNMSTSCFKAVFNRVVDFMVEEIAPQVIKCPVTNEDKEIIAKEFEKISGFPNVLGCIDSTYISTRTPNHKIRSTYANRHDCISITMQGICDSSLKFLDVYTGIPSKIHDSRVFKLSFISKEMATICGEKYHFLGDAAYPLREYLLTPYRDYGNLGEAEKQFNFKLSQTRVKIENAFGMLKGRFRQLMRLDFHEVETMAKFVLSCCALHNICIERNEIWSIGDNIDNIRNDNVNGDILTHSDVRDNIRTRLGEIKRNNIKNQICNS